MRRWLFFPLLGLLLASAACGNKFEKGVYGKWVEPLEGGVIEIRENNTVNWFDTEGTVDGKHDSSCYAFVPCDSTVKFKVAGTVYETGYRSGSFTYDPDDWHMEFKSEFVVPNTGKRTSSLKLKRLKGTASPLKIEGYRRMEMGLNDDLYPMKHYELELAGGHIFASDKQTLKRWNNENSSWDSVFEAPAGSRSVDFVFGDEAIYEIEKGRFSLDGGDTWLDAPSREALREPGCHIGHPWVTGTKLFVLKERSLGLDEEPGVFQNTIWVMDLTNESPTWDFRSHLDYGADWFLELSVVTQTGDLFLQTSLSDSDQQEFKHSRDGGVTWEDFDYSPAQCGVDHVANQIYFHSTPFSLYCKGRNEESKWDWYWFFNTKNDTWVKVQPNSSRSSGHWFYAEYLMLSMEGGRLVGYKEDGFSEIVETYKVDKHSHPTFYLTQDKLIRSEYAFWIKDR